MEERVGITVAGNSDGRGLVRRRKKSLRRKPRKTEMNMCKSSKHMKRGNMMKRILFFLLPVETTASRRP